MTDARLPGYWLTELRFADMSDRHWRIFTNALMWSAEQGTDGHIPPKYLRRLHDEEVTDDDVSELEVAGVFVRAEDGGIDMPGWSDEKALRQSTAASVAQYRSRKKENQAAYRQRLRERSESGDVTGNVGKGSSSLGDSSKEGASAYLTGNVTGNALRRNCDAHPDGWAKPCRACGEARKRAEAQDKEAPRKQFRATHEDNCATGNHRWMGDGTCLHCTERRYSKTEEWMNR